MNTRSGGPSGRRRALSAVAGGLAGFLACWLLRGSHPRPWGTLLHGDADLLLRDVAGFVAGAFVAGTVAPLVAGNHVPGLPLLALALSWLSSGLGPPAAEASAASRAAFERDALLVGCAELLVLAAAVGVTTTACWLVDTRITFPRIYPDPGDRPPAKHTSRRDLYVLLVPHLVCVAAIVGGGAWLAARAAPGSSASSAALVAVASVAAVAAAQRVRPARGSIWTALGVLAGLAVAVAVVSPAVQACAELPALAGRPWVLLVAGLSLGSAIATRLALAR